MEKNPFRELLEQSIKKFTRNQNHSIILYSGNIVVLRMQRQAHD